MSEKIKYAKSQAMFTFFFDSDFEPSVLGRMIGVNPSKIVLKKDAVVSPLNPKGHGFFQISTNVADEPQTEIAVATILRVFIGKEDAILKILNENNGYCVLDLFIKQTNGTIFPKISLSTNAIKVLSKLNAQFNLKLM
ncbi:MAG: DUF4279 domain-containing protein [Christensenellales bacterium]